jgi:hypothetical protein
MTDLNNCGTCGNACHLDETCAAGSCMCMATAMKCACPAPPNGGECTLHPQCGCSPGQGCYPTGSNGASQCLTAGTKPLLSACTQASDCAPGLTCVYYSGAGYSAGLCKSLCGQDGDCSGVEPGRCTFLGGTSGVSFCEISCDPTNPSDTQNNFQACPAGIACGEVGSGSMLHEQDCTGPVGSVTSGACQHNSDCAPGYTCASAKGDPSGTFCHKLCTSNADCGTKTCCGTLQCGNFGILRSGYLGVCE